MLPALGQSFVFAWRLLLRQPGQSCLAIMALGLGLGLVSTQFSLTDGILLRGLPFPNSGRIVHVSRLNPKTLDPNSWELIPYRDYEVYRENQTSFTRVAAIASFAANVTRKDGVPVNYMAAQVTANLLDVLTTQPEMGRWFAPEENAPGQAAFVVLSHRMWQNDFGAAPDILGKGLTVNGEAATVIGVMPAGFTFPSRQLFWTNLRQEPRDPRERTATGVEIVGLLKPNLTLGQAKSSLESIAQHLAERYPESNTGYTRLNVERFTYAYSGTGTEPLLVALLAMTSFILLLACVNVASLLVARASRRCRELAVRQALGARRLDIIQQVLCESMLLAGLGAMLGIGLAHLGTSYLQRSVVEQMQVPFWFDFRVDHRVLMFIAGLAVLTGLISGWIPAWKASRMDVNEVLKDESRGASGMRQSRFFRWLVTGQVTLACALLIAAGAQVLTVFQLRTINLTFRPDNLLLGRLEIQDAVYPSPEARIRFYERLLDGVRRMPGVASAAVSSRDLIGGGVGTRCEIEGQVYHHDGDKALVQLEVISPDYFETIGVSVLEGRAFEAQDAIGARAVALVNRSFAERHWPGQSSLGKRIRHNEIDAPWTTIVGVVPDLHMAGIVPGPAGVKEGIYLCQNQKAWGWLYLLVRTRTEPTTLVNDLRRAVANIDPLQPIHSFGTLQERTETGLRGFEVVGTQVLVFGLITVFLGAVGIYGVTAFSVGQRTREFGVRMAVGATTKSVLGLVFRQGAIQVGAGLVLGCLLALGLLWPTRSFTAAEVTLHFDLVILVVMLLVLGISGAAIWIPARRAATIDPLKALRHE